MATRKAKHNIDYMLVADVTLDGTVLRLTGSGGPRPYRASTALISGLQSGNIKDLFDPADRPHIQSVLSEYRRKTPPQRHLLEVRSGGSKILCNVDIGGIAGQAGAPSVRIGFLPVVTDMGRIMHSDNISRKLFADAVSAALEEAGSRTLSIYSAHSDAAHDTPTADVLEETVARAKLTDPLLQRLNDNSLAVLRDSNDAQSGTLDGAMAELGKTYKVTQADIDIYAGEMSNADRLEAITDALSALSLSNAALVGGSFSLSDGVAMIDAAVMTVGGDEVPEPLVASCALPGDSAAAQQRISIFAIPSLCLTDIDPGLGASSLSRKRVLALINEAASRTAENGKCVIVVSPGIAELLATSVFENPSLYFHVINLESLFSAGQAGGHDLEARFPFLATAQFMVDASACLTMQYATKWLFQRNRIKIIRFSNVAAPGSDRDALANLLTRIFEVVPLETMILAETADMDAAAIPDSRRATLFTL